MKIANAYLLIFTPSLILSLILAVQFPSSIGNYSNEILHFFGIESGWLAEKLSRFIADSLSNISEINNILLICLMICFICLNILIFLNFENRLSMFCFFVALFSFPVLNMFVDATWIRRLIFSVLVLSTVPKLWNYTNVLIRLIGRDKNFKRILRCVSGICFLIFVIPGFYLPPFFDGIAGWSRGYNKPLSYEFTSIRIRFTDNSVVWFRPSFFEPLTQGGRPIGVIRRRDPEFFESDKMFNFLFALYAKAHPALDDKKLPTERILGWAAYPPHTLDKFDDREVYLPPSDVSAFERVEVVMDEGIRRERLLRSWSRYD